MDVVFVIDLRNPVHLNQREQAFEEVKNVCSKLNANCHHIQFDKLESDEATVLERFYNADVVLIDLSVDFQRNCLFYHLGVRESYCMKQNILTSNDQEIGEKRFTMPQNLASDAYPLLTYQVQNNQLFLVTKTPTDGPAMESKPPLKEAIELLLQDFVIQSKAHIKEKFLSDLQRIKETLSDNELKNALHSMRKRLDNPDVVSEDTIHSMLISLREIEEYDAMVDLVNTLDYLEAIHKHRDCAYLYAFALNRRNQEGDREDALSVVLKVLEEKENRIPGLVGLCGRIYKDKFAESGYTDKSSLHQAIHWYRQGFEIQPNEYAGINLATLLVIDGNEFLECEELQHIGMVVNHLIGKRGSLDLLKDYWAIATFFEMSVLMKNYGKAIEAAECMFKLKVPNWQLKSTMGNVNLIKQFRKQESNGEPEETIFNFWVEYFTETSKNEMHHVSRIPVLILQPNHEFMPSYVELNLDPKQKYLQITNLCLECLKLKCEQKHQWLFKPGAVKSLSSFRQDDRCIFLCAYENSEDFHMYFPNKHYRNYFHDFVQKLA